MMPPKNYNKNFLILGKTGAGKSSLIDLIMEKKVTKTGAGKPVTGRACWQKETYVSPFEENTTLTFFDSWGLEANKADQWKSLVDGRLRADWNEEMICGVIYCFNYNNTMEPFEWDMLRYLLQTGYKVLIVLTNLDEATPQKRKDYPAQIKRQLGKFAKQYAVAEVINEDGEKLDGRVYKKTGREEVLKALGQFSTENLYTLYCNGLLRVYTHIAKFIDAEITAMQSEETFLALDLGTILALDLGTIFVDPAPGWWSKPQAVEETELEKRLEQYKYAFFEELKKFGKVYEAVYNVKFQAPPPTWWQRLLAFFGSYAKRNQKLLAAYKDALVHLKKQIQRTCAQLRKQRQKVYFVKPKR